VNGSCPELFDEDCFNEFLSRQSGQRLERVVRAPLRCRSLRAG
jgi:hypothetical protein